MKNLIILLLLIIPNFSFAAVEEIIVQEPGGRLRVPVSDYNANGIKTWGYLDNKGDKFFQEYSAVHDKSLSVRHASSGMVSSKTVPARFVASVPRQTVLKNLLTKAVAGGRIAAGIGSGPVGWALTATTAYELVAPALKEEGGYSYDPKQGNFVKPSDGDITIYFYIPNTMSANKRIVNSVELSNAGIYEPYYRDKVVEHLLRTNRKLIVISKDRFTDDQLCKIIDPSYISEGSDICMGPGEKYYTLKA